MVQPRTAATLTAARASGLTALVFSCYATAAAAQFPEPSESRTVDVTAVFGCNVLLGGLTAAARAFMEGHDPARAFAIGAIGGAVYFGAKLIGPGAGLAGVAVSATGNAIVVNAGRGVNPLDELYVPVGPMRVRIMPRAPTKLRLTVHAFDTFLLARNLTRSGLDVDWGRSASTGTLAFLADGRHIIHGGREVGGAAIGPIILIGGFSRDPARTTRHELVHAHQYWFVDEVLGRPVEQYLRARVPGGTWLPRWLELGVVPPAYVILEQALFGRDGPVRRLAESEASILERP